jgi:SAM-dependent methyltransferase/GNAT superfamily N-acetyltransferase
VSEARVRLAVDADAAAISAVLRSAFAEYQRLYTPEGFAATTPGPDAVLQRMSEGPIWVADRGGEIIGTVAAVCDDGGCYIRGMGVAPDSRARGAGALLLKEVEIHAIRKGARRTYLSTTPFLDRAIRLYERFGFRRSEEGPIDLFGTPLFTMTKPLREDYVLATGEAAAIRLRLIDEIFGLDSRALLTAAGLRPGLRVAEIGCGSGLVASWMAGMVAPDGSVCAVDSGAGQLRVAREHAESEGIRNISFHERTATETGLARESFDLVYSRFLMCHLTKPAAALREMRALLRDGGMLICEDFDVSSVLTAPPSRAYERLVEIGRHLDVSGGVDSEIGLKLHVLFREAGFERPEVALKLHSALRGGHKRFWELTLREAATAIVQSGAASAKELEEICDEMRAIAEDETTLVVLARVAQVWARK